ncbi:MAG: ADP-ribosylglycohydrolase family protein [Vulcanimicrobiota bacterium]
MRDTLSMDAVIGSILGTAVGDALGLVCEGLSRKRQHTLFPVLKSYRFFFGRGMTSDDTEHAAMTAESLIMSAGDPVKFRRELALRLKIWLLTLPAGLGLATLKSSVKLLCGISPERSGVRSAGNGPAMRSPIIGVLYGDEPERMKELVTISTRMTHTDERAVTGAVAVANAAYLASRSKDEISVDEFRESLNTALPSMDSEFTALLDKMSESARAGQNAADFAASLGFSRGISGYIYNTVVMVLHCWLRNQHDFESGLIEIIECGGDTDTTAAILGAILGARVRKDGIPPHLLSHLMEWPRTVQSMEKLASTAYTSAVKGEIGTPPPLPFTGFLARNLFFLTVVLLHELRRMLPPY